MPSRVHSPGSLAFFMCIGVAAWSAPARAEDWRTVADSDGVKVYRRSHAGSSVDEFKGVGLVHQPAERIFAVLSDMTAYPEVLPPTVEARRLRRDGDSAWFYMVINPPVVSRRDYCTLVKLSRPADGTLRSDWTVANDDCPKKHSGLVRIAENTGTWLLRAVGSDTTEVSYQAHTDPGGDLPAWIVNRVTSSSVIDLFVSLRKAAALRRYEGCHGGFDGCPGAAAKQ